MALTVNALRRVFIYNGTELADPGTHLGPQQVADIYSPAFPELLNTSIEGPEIKNGKAIYKFFKAAGGKG